METKLSDRLQDLAGQLSHAGDVKRAAKLRSQCSLEEWILVKKEAKRLFTQRKNVLVSQRRA
jgi:hypothetical protein